MFVFQRHKSPVTVYYFVAFRHSSAKYSVSGSFKIVYGYIKVPLELMEIISAFFQGLFNVKWSGERELEILVQDPKITYLKNCPNNFNPEKPSRSCW